MFRSVAAVILGYLGMALWIVLSGQVALRFLGRDFAVDADTNTATAAWIALNVPLGFIGATLGGWVTASIAKAKAATAVRALATLVLVLGLFLAVSETMRGDMPTPATEEEAEMIPPRQPVWYAFFIPLVGVAGVLAGGAIRSRAASHAG